jgi:hypothetical protein
MVGRGWQSRRTHIMATRKQSKEDTGKDQAKFQFLTSSNQAPPPTFHHLLIIMSSNNEFIIPLWINPLFRSEPS